MNKVVNKYKKCSQKFKDEIKGYHKINISPITGTKWEDINNNIVKENMKVTEQALGNHKPGKDSKHDNIRISNKAGLIKSNNMVSISSYRLTTKCNKKIEGDEKKIREEIIKRDNSFDYYSLLLRVEEDKKTLITYNWYIVPKDHNVFKINKLEKIYNKENKCSGWKSDNCSIHFSMSSQLWFNFNIKLIEKYKINFVKIKVYNTITYAEVYKLLKLYK